jgi:hypothetical protein
MSKLAIVVTALVASVATPAFATSFTRVRVRSPGSFWEG